jgi:hypothetical protein
MLKAKVFVHFPRRRCAIVPQPENVGTVQQSPTFSRILGEVGNAFPIRQRLFREIQEKTGRRLISYVAILAGVQGTDINPIDIPGFADLLKNIGPTESLDLLINSLGGSADVAEKIVELCRGQARHFRVIVPNFAKSAATLIALGADQILMSDTSQLGPIDPQFIHVVRPGQAIFVPAHSIIRSYEELVERVNAQGKLLPADVPQLAGMDLAYIELARTAIARAETLATTWLKKYMLNGRDQQAQETVQILVGRRPKYLSHGQVVNHVEAAELLHLSTEYLRPDDPLWELIWELYVRSDMFCHQTQQAKLFESDSISMGVKFAMVGPVGA